MRNTTPTTTRQSAHSQTEHRGSLVPLFVALVLAMLLAALNQTVLSTALPTIVGELHGAREMLWVITAFILASTVMMPVYGKLGDLIGRRSLLIAAISIFMFGSVIGGLAPDMPWLIAARVIQGLGGGGLMVLAQAIIADVVPARERGKYAGVMGGVFALASVAGPLLGGWFTEGPGWRWVFWINIPLGILALAGAIFFLKLPRHRVRRRLDILGMLLLAAGTTCLVLFATWAGTLYEWTHPLILALIACTVVSAAAFVAVERRTAEPVIPLDLFRDRNFTLATTAGLLIGIAMFGVLSYVPTYLQMAFGLDATMAGLLMVPMMGSLIVSATVSGAAVSRTGRYKWMPVAGALLVTAALALLSTVQPGSQLVVLGSYLSLLGIGLGLNMQLLILIVQNSFPRGLVGTATASMTFFRQIGASLGAAIIGSIFSTRLTTFLSERVPAGAIGDNGGVNALTPAAVAALPQSVRDVIVSSYSEALTPLFLWIAPLGLIATILLAFVHEKPLATTLDGDATATTDGDEVAAPSNEQAA